MAKYVLDDSSTVSTTSGAAPPLDLSLIGGIILAVADAALIAYYSVTQLQKP